jgi:hypothetical protein
VVFGGGVFGGGVAVALLGDDVQQPRHGHVFHVLERGEQRVEVVAVDGADVVEAELFEQRAGHDHALHVLFPAPDQLAQVGHAAARACLLPSRMLV